MNIVKIRDVSWGRMPKICVPITGRTKKEIRLRLEELLEPARIWRSGEPTGMKRYYRERLLESWIF